MPASLTPHPFAKTKRFRPPTSPPLTSYSVHGPFVLDITLDSLKLIPTEWEIFSSPLPVKRALAFILRRVKETTRADLFINNRDRLQSIRKNDIRIHSCDIQMIDKWVGIIMSRIRHISERLKFINDLLSKFLIVINILYRLRLLNAHHEVQ